MMERDLGSTKKPPIKNLSVSKIEDILQCGLKFKHRYIDHIPSLRGGIPHAGTVVHTIVEHALREYAKTGKYPDWQTLDDMYEPTWEAKVKEEEEKPWFLGWQWDEDDPEEKVKREYRPLVRLAREEALPHVKPWILGDEPMVEHRIDLELQSDIGSFQLVGYLDLLDEAGILMDWKTINGDKVSKLKKRNWLQFAAYSLYVWPIVGDEDVRCRKVFLLRGGDGGPKVEYCDYVIGAGHREFFVKTAASAWKMVMEGAYLPGPNGWWCDPDWCPFWAMCLGDLSIGNPGVESK